MGEPRTDTKVLMLESGGWGGIHQYAHALANALTDAGVEVVLLTAERYELQDRPCRFRRFQVLRRENYLVTLVRIARILQRERPAVVHLQSLVSQRKDLLLLLLFRLWGARLVMTVHNLLPHEVRWGERRLYLLYYRLVEATILHSERNRQDLLALEPRLNPARVHRIPHGNYAYFRDLELSRQEARARLGLAPTGRLALFLGAIRPYKGLDLFLRLVRPVRAACPEVRFAVAGMVLRGDQAEYDRQIAELGLEPEDLSTRFSYLTHAESVAYVCAADLVVLPYRAIYQSGILLFAFTFGRPVVATRVGSFPETVEDGRSGWLVESEDVEGMVSTLVRVFRAPTELEAAGAYARDQAERQYGWPGIARCTAALYAEVLTGEKFR